MRRRSRTTILIGCSCALPITSFVVRSPHRRPFATSTGDVGSTPPPTTTSDRLLTRRRHRIVHEGGEGRAAVGTSSALPAAWHDANQEDLLPMKSLSRKVDEIPPSRLSNATCANNTVSRRVPTVVPLAVAAGVLLGSSALPAPNLFLSNALDHPVDHALLGIPSPVPDARFFVAGGISAATSHGITTPVDVIKTRMQSDNDLQKLGLVKAAIAVWRQDGPRVLLEGLGPTVVGYGFEGAIKFGLYESMKPAFAGWLHTASDDLSLPYLLASVTAGAVASVILCPMEQLRIRAVTDPSFGGLPDLLKETGIVGLFRGLPAMLSKQVPYTYGKQVTYDEFASFLYGVGESNFGLSEASIKVEVSVIAAFLASMAACLLSHPGDVVLTRTYSKSSDLNSVKTTATAEAGASKPSRDFVSTVQNIYAKQGLGGFVAGLSARLVHVGVIVTSQLVLYDSVKQLLGLPATGAH